MSSIHEKFKLNAKRGQKPNNLNQSRQVQDDAKKKPNLAVKKSLKRCLSSDGDGPNKKTTKQCKTENSGISRNSSATSKVTKGKDPGSTSKNVASVEPNDRAKPKYTGSSKYSANDRLAVLRKNIKDAPSTSKKSESKDSNLIIKTNRDASDQTIKSDAKPSFKPNFKIPIKKSANDRIKLARESNLRPEDKTSVILKSPKMDTTYNLNKSCDDTNKNLHTSPLKKLCRLGNSSGQKISCESANTDTSTSKRSKTSEETSFRLSSEYIIISEASSSEKSPKNLTPVNKRLNSIKDCSSSSSNNKTLTPGSTNALTEEVEEYFQTPVRSHSVASGLKVPLNINLFKRRTETAVQTETNIFKSPTHVPEQPASKNIFGEQVHSNIFQNAGVSSGKTDTIFDWSGQNQNHNNNIFSGTNIRKNDQGSIFGANISKNNIFSDYATEIPIDEPDTRDSASGLHKLIYAHQPAHSSKSLKAEDTTDQPGDYSQKPIQRLRKSATDRLARIKNEGCNTYRKNEVCVLPGKGQKSIQEMESDQIMGQFTENPLNTNLRIQEFKGTLQLPANPCQPSTKEYLTESWLSNHQATSKGLDTTINDSMVVNVDDTILNKSELQDPIEDTSMDWDMVPEATDTLQPIVPTPTEPTKENIICIVTDTNVFMHFLHKIKDTVSLRVSGSQKVKIYVPWMVLKELDHLKDHSGEPTRSIALDAERFINRYLVGPDSKIIGQSVLEVSQQEDIGKDPDDKILSCCMQAVKRYKSVILLTNDINLRNKAIACQIENCSPRDISTRLSLIMSKFCKIRSKLQALWSKIICDCCKQAFGEAWKKMDMLQNPPWSIIECIKRFKKYWGSVFRDLLLKQSLKSIDGLHAFFMKHRGDIADDSEEFISFMKLVVDFLVFLQDLSNHKIFIKNMLKEITSIADER